MNDKYMWAMRPCNQEVVRELDPYAQTLIFTCPKARSIFSIDELLYKDSPHAYLDYRLILICKECELIERKDMQAVRGAETPKPVS